MNPYTKKQGFTLIELLTVIAIIGILAAIIIPTVGAVRDSARTTRCGSNIRQTAVAFLMLVNENRGTYVGRAGGSDTAAAAVWTSELADKGFIGGKRQGANTEAIEVYYCPTWPDDTGNNNHNWRTFGLNMMTGSTNPRLEGNGEIQNNIYRVNYNRIETPSRFPLFADTYRTANTSQSFRIMDDITQGGIHLRHKNHAHVAFLDGSVRKMNENNLAEVGINRVWVGEIRPPVERTLSAP